MPTYIQTLKNLSFEHFCTKLNSRVQLRNFRVLVKFFCSKIRKFTKAELLQLNRTQFSSLGIFISKKVGNRKIKTTFIISVLKVVLGGLTFFDFQLFYR